MMKKEISYPNDRPTSDNPKNFSTFLNNSSVDNNTYEDSKVNPNISSGQTRKLDPDKLFEDICGPLVFSDVNIQYIIAELKKRNIQFNTMAEFQKVVTQIQKVNKNTRKWSLKGYTENELALIPSKKLLGRNEPCLCGSGRKYKKCCGKNV